jgi:hypothetical protein
VQRQLHSAGDASPPAALLLLKYSRYSQSSRLAGGAPRRPQCDAGVAPPAARRRVPTDTRSTGPENHFRSWWSLLMRRRSAPGELMHVRIALARRPSRPSCVDTRDIDFTRRYHLPPAWDCRPTAANMSSRSHAPVRFQAGPQREERLSAARPASDVDTGEGSSAGFEPWPDHCLQTLLIIISLRALY